MPARARDLHPAPFTLTLALALAPPAAAITAPVLITRSPDRTVTLTTVEQRTPSNFRVIVHIEAYEGAGPASSDVEVFVNCPSRRIHVERIESFTENGGRGVQSTAFGPKDWGRAAPGGQDERIVAVVCGGQEAPSPAPVLAASTRSVMTAAVPAAPPPAPVAPRSSARVQLFAASGRSAADRFAASLADRGPGVGDRPVAVRTAEVRGRTVYRVLVEGFPSGAEATGFCARLKAAGQDCLVRQ